MTLGRVFAAALAVAVLCLLGFATLASDIAFAPHPSFDTRLGGYTPQEARAYLGWLEAEGLREAYTGAFQWLDTLFPMAVMLVLATAIIGLWARPVRAVAMLGVVICLGYMGFDYLENAAVGRMIEAGAAGLQDATVERASLMTQLKWVCVFAAVLLIAAGLALTALRSGRKTEES